ncbi:hypothetical protein ES332_D02G274800v1 [Gossypium tomentosum]|uniref:Auxin-responsive protein n=1 Tax=Gossypium tomentosum TaxID=34277 RepID=A0A5D2M2Y1_GOSTO|nr:hypothetical protein ES332_D02G274800v1 [Gossypium tomentosum]
MSQRTGKCRKIRHIVRIRQMLKQWRKKARITANDNIGHAPSDVPAGHVAVCVGTGLKRYIVRATCLNHPIFKSLLVQTEKSTSLFEEILRVVSRSDSSSNSGRLFTFEDLQRRCHVGMKNKQQILSESRPLFHRVGDRSVY